MNNPSWTTRERKLIRILRSVYFVELAVYVALLYLFLHFNEAKNVETFINSFWTLCMTIPFILLVLSTLFFIGSFTTALDKKTQTSHMAMPTFICMLIANHFRFERYLNTLHTERMQKWQTRELTDFTTYLTTHHTLDTVEEKAVLRFITYFLSHNSHTLYVTDKGLPYRNSNKNMLYENERSLYDFYISDVINRFHFQDTAVYTFIASYAGDLDDLELYTQTYHLMPKSQRKSYTHHVNLWCAFYSGFLRALFTELDDTVTTVEEPRITPAAIEKLKAVESDISERYKDYLN